MEISELLQSMVNQANVRAVYGEPVTAAGITIVPVARIRYGFRGGLGRPAGEESGGGVVGVPVGVVEITREGTRFIPIGQPWKLVMAAAVGVCVGLMAAKKRVR